MNQRKHVPFWLGIPLAILGVISFLIIGFAIWGSTPIKPMPEVFDMVPGISDQEIKSNSLLAFIPDGSLPDTGFILYPGGHVDYRAYAPIGQAIADQGFLVILVQMPFSLAVLNPEAALDVISAYPEIEHWVMGGHSLGGAMAANFVFNNPGIVDGLVLWAAYPAKSNDLQGSTIKVLTISGTVDGLSTPEKIQISLALLPVDTIWISIEGGSHAQFGWYGEQNGDNHAAISRVEQQALIVQATSEFLDRIR